MNLSQRVRGNLRSIIGLFLKITFTLYVISLPFSALGAEISGWATAVILVIYYCADRLNSKRDLEIHTLGAEIPLVLFLIMTIISIKMGHSDSDFFAGLGELRNFILLYVFAYSFQVIKNLNRTMFVLAATGTFVAGCILLNHFVSLEGIPLFLNLHESNPSLFNHSLMMILCIPWATLLFFRRWAWWVNLLSGMCVLIILTHFAFSFGRGVWIACMVTMPVMAIFAGRRIFITTLAGIAVFGSLLYNFSPTFRERAQATFVENYSNEVRKNLWHINMEMFRDHPWLGVGYNQNEKLCATYFDKVGIKDGVCDNAHSNYVQLLSTGGLLGFIAFMLFAITYLLMTARLLSVIPETHLWHKVFGLAALGAQISFHVGGLTQWNFGDLQIQYQFLFWLALVGYMAQRYFIHIVSDDRSL